MTEKTGQPPDDWDFTKTDVLEEETQVRWTVDGVENRSHEEIRIYHRAPKVSNGICLEFDSGVRVPIGDKIRVGRNFFNEVVVFGDTFVSRRHAEVGNKDGKLYVIDLGSRNGTYLNGRPIPQRKESPLKAGDTILFGSTVEARVAPFEDPPKAK